MTEMIKKHMFWLFFIFILCWQILLTFQGLDLADTGFHLTAFSQIFNAPDSVQYSMMFWLSDIVGALWMKLFPSGGLYWIRIGWVVCSTATFLIYYSLLRMVLSQREALLSLTVILVFILQGGPECLNYDVLTTLGYGIGIFFLIKGLLRSKGMYLLISGLVFGICLFLKLSNLAYLGFWAVIVFTHIIYRNSKCRLLVDSVCWLSGVVVGMALILILIHQLGHWELFVNNLIFTSQMGADESASHGLIPLLKSYVLGYINAFVMLLIGGFVVWCFNWFSGRQTRGITQSYQTMLLIAAATLTLVLSILFKDVFWSKVRYLLIGVMIAYGTIAMFDARQSGNTRLLAFSGLLLLVIAPLGSDSGLAKSVWGMWLLGPLALVKMFDFEFMKRHFSLDISKIVRQAFVLVIGISAVIYAWQHTYFDVGSRLDKRYTVDHPKLRGIYTSEKRAEAMNEVINNAFPIIEKEEYLLGFIEIPMFNYLTDTKPFITTSWPKLYYNADVFAEKLDDAVKNKGKLPVIIRQLQATKLEEWPVDNVNGGNSYMQWPEHGVVLDNFIRKYNYVIVWENEMFQLLIKKGSEI
ncbi:hypothetical protein EYV94_12390 [Puteibacter caeruleilacunae]|nr:hypothetical protein EYV94_12390 [Puteibacter caeruleilacunae]